MSGSCNNSTNAAQRQRSGTTTTSTAQQRRTRLKARFASCRSTVASSTTMDLNRRASASCITQGTRTQAHKGPHTLVSMQGTVVGTRHASFTHLCTGLVLGSGYSDLSIAQGCSLLRNERPLLRQPLGHGAEPLSQSARLFTELAVVISVNRRRCLVCGSTMARSARQQTMRQSHGQRQR